MVTLADIAQKCNVSKASVSKALNGHGDIGKETADYIKKTAQELGYFPNATARALKSGKTHNIGVLFVDKTASGLAHEFFSKILESAKSESESLGYDLTFISKNIGSTGMDYYDHAKYRQCDGVIIASVDFDDPSVLKLVNSDIPTVTLDYVFNNRTSIVSDNVKGMEELVKFVYSKGHRKLAFIHGEETSVTQRRIASFHKTCADLGIRIPPEYVLTSGYHDPKGSGIATKKLLELRDRPTCIFYPDDFSFIGGMNALEQAGLSIPDDMSVVGYDGILLSQTLRPRLTTYQQDALFMGEEAARQLIENIEHPNSWLPKLISVPGKILEGDTVKQL